MQSGHMPNENGPKSCRTLLDLPVEILEEIYVFAHSSAFPQTCKRIHSTVKSFSPVVHAYYILRRHPVRIFPSYDPTVELSPFLSSALRYPIATLAVLESLYGFIMRSDGLMWERLHPFELPKRLFRSLGESDATRDENSDPLPILRFLWEDHVGLPKPKPYSYGGYPLMQAVQAEFIPLVQFLLDHGAHPGRRAYSVVKVAIGKKNVTLVKMLMEVHAVTLKKRQVFLDMAVKCDAQDIVKYFMEEQGCDSLIIKDRTVTGPA